MQSYTTLNLAVALLFCMRHVTTAHVTSLLQLPLGVHTFIDMDYVDKSLSDTSVSLRQGTVSKDTEHPLIFPEYPWEASVHFYTSLTTVPPQYSPSNITTYILYYACAAQDSILFWANVSVCVANSTDGYTWVKPLLNYYPWTNNGTQPPVPSNIVFVTDVNEFLGSVFVDTRPGTDPNSLFKLAYESETGRYVHVATSPDGYNFSAYPGRSVNVSGFADTQVGMLYDDTNDAYLVFGRQDGGPSLPNSTNGCLGGYPSERRVLATLCKGSDGVHDPDAWVQPIKEIFSLGAPDPINCFDSYNPAPSRYQGGIYLFPSAFHHWSEAQSGAPISRAAGNDGVMDIRMLVARDVIIIGGNNTTTTTTNEISLPSFSFITRDSFVSRGVGDIDPSCGLVNATGSDRDAGFVFATIGGILDPDPLLQLSTNIHFLYWGSQTTHAGGGAFLGRYWPGAYSGIFRARVRREGFVSLSTSPSNPFGNGSFTSINFALPANSPSSLSSTTSEILVLRLNAEIATAGSVTVEIIDGVTLQPLAGWSGDASIPLHLNSIRQTVSWTVNGDSNTTTSDLSPLVGYASGIRFRVTMVHTNLYAWELKYM